jgi:citrate/tricarballylate utilization protein
VLLGLRATVDMGIALAVHLGWILSLFVLLPYSRMVHGVYRTSALLRAAAWAMMMKMARQVGQRGVLFIRG